MAERFIAHPPGEQAPDTYRQFVELQRYIERLEDRLRPRAAVATIAPLTLTDAWQDVQLSQAVGTDLRGLVQLRFDCRITGTTGVSEAQFRWVFRQTILTGAVISIGVGNSTAGRTLFDVADGAIGLQARGINAEILSGAVAVSQIAAAP